jgi:hypothetical protein
MSGAWLLRNKAPDHVAVRSTGTVPRLLWDVFIYSILQRHMIHVLSLPGDKSSCTDIFNLHVCQRIIGSVTPTSHACCATSHSPAQSFPNDLHCLQLLWAVSLGGT